MSRAFKLTNDTLLLSTEAPGGIYNSAQLKKIAALCDGEGAIVKATEDQRLALFVPVAKAQDIANQLQAVGIGIRHYQDGLHQPTNCIGALCPDHHQDAMGSALDVTEALAKTKLEAACKIGINGCARCCVPTHTLDISVVGDTNGYRISLGGKNSQLPEIASFMAEGVPAGELPKLLSKVVGVYKSLTNPDESLQDVIDRCGSKAFIEALAPYSQDAHQEDDFMASIGGEDVGDAAGEPMPVAEDLALDESDPMFDAQSEALAGFDTDDDNLSAAKASDFSGTESSFDDDLNPQSELAAQNGSVDINPGDFGAGAILDEDVAISGNEFATESSGSVDFNADEDDFVTPKASQDSRSGFAEPSHANTPSQLDELKAFAEQALSNGTSQTDAAGNFAGVEEDQVLMASDTDLSSDIALLDDSELMMVPDDGVDDLEQITGGDEAKGSAEVGKAASAVAEPKLGFQQPSAADAIDEFELAEEVNEDEADAFEAKLAESIADEESVPQAEDVNAVTRMEAMELMEAATNEADEEIGDSDAASATPEESFGDLEIDDDRFEMIANEDIDLNDEEHAIATARVAAKMTPKQPASTGGSVAVGAFGKSQRGAQVFQGFDTDGQGRVLLRFVSGVEMAFDPNTLSPGERREIMAYGQKIALEHTGSGLAVMIGGVGLTLPLKVA